MSDGALPVSYSRDNAEIRHPDGIRAHIKKGLTRNFADCCLCELGYPSQPRVARAVILAGRSGFELYAPQALQGPVRHISEGFEVSVSHVNSITLERLKCPTTAFKSS